MNFPIRILPNPAYKQITCDLSNHYLIRSAVVKDGDQLIDSTTGHVKDIYICSPREHMADLSTSLLGVFEIDDIKIQLTSEGKNKYNDYCEPNAEIDPVPVFENDFIEDGSKEFWVILIGDIQDTPVKYTKSNIPFEAICHVVHTPMKWNFWHFSIRWKTKEGFWDELDEKEKKILSKRLAQEARAHIAMFATSVEPNYEQLHRSEYVNQVA